MKINEIFLSIQGEGILSGLPTIFVRTTGCNLRCVWCDTKFSRSKGQEKSVGEVLKQIKRLKFKRVCLTGGEPLIQEELPLLIEQLLKRKYQLSIETNGSKDISMLPKEVVISLDIKCPSSNESQNILFTNLNFLSKKDQCKFVIRNKKDYEYAKRIIREYNLNKKTNVILTPVGGIKAEKIVERILRDKLDVRIGLQLHKIIWGRKRGV